MPFVTDGAMPLAHNEYVCWLDIMGTKSSMENSVNTCAIFMLKFHAAILEAIDKKKCNISTYPVMDGVYLTSKSRLDLEDTLFYVFSELGSLFIKEQNIHHKFLVKASIAYGPVIHGKEIKDSVNNALAKNKSYKNSLLLGLPMIQAITGEQKAPPFGIFVNESARTFSPEGEEPFNVKWWKWFLRKDSNWAQAKTTDLSQKVKEYFEGCEKQSLALDYPEDRIKAHKEAAKEYFMKL